MNNRIMFLLFVTATACSSSDPETVVPDIDMATDTELDSQSDLDDDSGKTPLEPCYELDIEGCRERSDCVGYGLSRWNDEESCVEEGDPLIICVYESSAGGNSPGSIIDPDGNCYITGNGINSGPPGWVGYGTDIVCGCEVDENGMPTEVGCADTNQICSE